MISIKNTLYGQKLCYTNNMIKRNYHKEMEKIVGGLTARPKLLLHSCCAPCSSSCLEQLLKHFDITVYYYNPNINTQEEFDKRAAEQCRLVSEMGSDIKIIEEEYISKEFFENVSGYENEPEGGARCRICIKMRMEKAANFAANNGFDFFTTTLSVSPLKNAEFINQAGAELAKKYGVSFLFSDFKKRGGYLRSIELSRDFKLYRQNYCGCIFSMK